MGRNTATINYAVGSIFGNAFPMYVFGSGILTFIHFGKGLLQSGSVEWAIGFAFDYYVSKLTPFPLDAALLLGVVVASYRYRKNRF